MLIPYVAKLPAMASLDLIYMAAWDGYFPRNRAGTPAGVHGFWDPCSGGVTRAAGSITG